MHTQVRTHIHIHTYMTFISSSVYYTTLYIYILYKMCVLITNIYKNITFQIRAPSGDKDEQNVDHSNLALHFSSYL